MTSEENEGDETEVRAEVARILEIRDTLIRVLWYYSPEELPKGRQPYHGQYEVIKSSGQDIISIDAILGSCEVIHWDEWDDTQKCLNVRFWRQILDVKFGKLNVICLDSL